MKKITTKKEPKQKALEFTDHMTYWAIQVEGGNGEWLTSGPFWSAEHARCHYSTYKGRSPNMRMRIIEGQVVAANETIIESSDNA